MSRNDLPKWVGYRLWVECNSLRDEGRVAESYTEGDIITFVTEKGSFSFYTNTRSRHNTGFRFDGDLPRKAFLVPPSSATDNWVIGATLIFTSIALYALIIWACWKPVGDFFRNYVLSLLH